MMEYFQLLVGGEFFDSLVLTHQTLHELETRQLVI